MKNWLLENYFNKISRKVLVFNLPWLVGWVFIFGMTFTFFNFFKIDFKLSTLSYYFPILLTFLNIGTYPFIKSTDKVRKLYPAFVIASNGLYALHFSLIHPPEFNGVLYLSFFFLGFIPVNRVYGLKGTLIYSLGFYLLVGLTYKVFSLPFQGDDLFSFCFMFLSSFFFTFLSEFNQKEREKELFSKLELEAKNENLNKMSEKISLMTEKLKEKNNDLIKLDHKKNKFVQEISHEIRTPLTLILNPLEEALKTYKEDRDLQIANEHALKLNRYVDKLLSFQKVNLTEKEINLIPINVSKFLKICSENIKETFKSNNISLEVKIQTDCILKADLETLEKILFTFLSNALEFTEEKGKVLLKAIYFEGKIKISVFNEGPILSEKERKEIFQDSFSTDSERFLLSLPLAKKLANIMGGNCGVEVENNKGMTFYCEFNAYTPKKNIDILFILKNLKSHKRPQAIFDSLYKCIYVSNFNKAKKLLEINSVKVICFDNQIEETQDKLDFIQTLYEESSLSSVHFLDDISFSDKKTVEKIKNDILKSSIKDLPVLFNFEFRDILLIDNGDGIDDFTKKVEGFNIPRSIHYVSSLEKARLKIKEFVYKVIVFDSSFYGSEGVNFLEKVKLEFPSTKRVLLTTIQKHKEMRKELKEDMFHIFKFRPWEKLKLIREIDKLLSESDLNIFSHYNPQKWHFSGIARKANVQSDEGETQKIEKYYKGNVLIVDKSYDMKTILSKILESGDYFSVGVSSYTEAIETMVSKKFDIVIIDFVVGKDAGPGLISSLKTKEEFKDIPFILMTAKSGEEGQILEGIEFDGLLGKPFNKAECLSLVDNLFNLQKNISLNQYKENLLEIEKKNNLSLDTKVKERTREIENILNNMKHSIFTIDEKLCAIPPISAYSEKIFGEEIKDKNIFEFLYSGLEEGTKDYNDLKKTFSFAFFEDERQFLVLEDQLPKQVTLSKGNKVLKVSYRPLFNQVKLVERILLVIEDITEFEKFYKSALSDQLNFEFIKEIVPREDKETLFNIVQGAISFSMQYFDHFISPDADGLPVQYFKNSMELFYEEIEKSFEGFDYLKELVLSKRPTDSEWEKVPKNVSFHLHAIDKLTSCLEYLLKYSKVLEMFVPYKKDYGLKLSEIGREKMEDLDKLFKNLLEYVFLVRDIDKLDKEKLSKVVKFSKLYPDFEKVISLLTQRTLFLSFVYRLQLNEYYSEFFDTMSSLLGQIPSREKLTASILKHNLISPYQKLLEILREEKKAA